MEFLGFGKRGVNYPDDFINKAMQNDIIIVELPDTLEGIYDSINDSKYILHLQDDWDEEGGMVYKESTWKSAILFIANYASITLTRHNKIIDSPEIHHGPNGSIDILWTKESYRLLINVPENPEEPATFYGDNYAKETIKGTFDPSKHNEGLLNCLLSLF